VIISLACITRREHYSIFGLGNASSMVTNVVLVVVFVGVVVISFSKYQKFSILQPIVIKLHTYIGDNIIRYRTVSDFHVK